MELKNGRECEPMDGGGPIEPAEAVKPIVVGPPKKVKRLRRLCRTAKNLL